MKNRLYAGLLLLLTGFLPVSCARQIVPAGTGAEMPGPHCIVYRTMADYDRQVPVILSADKANMLSYPDVKDVQVDGQYPYPTPLEDGYLLDNRGIGPGVAFLKLTYAEYAALPATPNAALLMSLILDGDPLAEMYDCGLRSSYGDPVADMNRLIRSGGLAGKKCLK